ncbi:MAG: FtsX-like permease family protein [Candidatus Dormibacteraceae bacterium]
MGTVFLVWRLAVKDILHRRAQAVLLLLAIAAGATTLMLGLSLEGTANNPYATTRAATNGPDVVATLVPGVSHSTGPSTGAPGGGNGPGPSDVSELVPLETANGVAAYSGPFPVTWTSLRKGPTTATAEIEGRGTAASAVDSPMLLKGRWVRVGGVVVEAGFASALGIHVGDRLNLGPSAFDVVGIGVTAAFPTYGQVCYSGCFLVGSLGSYNPGLVWMTESDVAQLAQTSSDTVFYFLNLKLTDPAAAPGFADGYNATASPNAPSLFSWQYIRAADAKAIADVQTALIYGSWLLALLALASVLVLAGGRMAEQARRVGLLKAVGGTPEFVALVLLFENVLVGLGAAALGVLAGWLVLPLVDGPGASLIGAPSPSSVNASSVSLVVALAIAVAILATLVPAIRTARLSTIVALRDSARLPRRRAWVIRLSASMPPPLLLGVRLATRQPRRLLLNAFSVAVSASGLVAVLVVHATAGNFLKPNVGEALTVISIILVLLASVNAVIIAWRTALDARRSSALSRALGATPGQVMSGLSLAQLLPALIGALLGIPGGIGLSHAASAVNSGSGAFTVPPILWLVEMVVGTLVVVALLTAITTRIDARRPVAEALQSQTV